LQLQRKKTAYENSKEAIIRVAPELRHDAETVLREGESLFSFMEQALRSSIHSRRAQKEFIARGLASSREANQTGEYFAAKAVLVEMKDLLSKHTPRPANERSGTLHKSRQGRSDSTL